MNAHRFKGVLILLALLATLPAATAAQEGVPVTPDTGEGLPAPTHGPGSSQAPSLPSIAAEDPAIVVDPASLWAEQCPHTVTTQALHICNVGSSDLVWSLTEGRPKGPAADADGAVPASNPETVLWDQPLSTVNQYAYVNQEFTDYPTYSSYLADDFQSTQQWVIRKVFVPGNGWNGFSSLLDAEALTWQIYADGGGMPNGDPSGAGSPPVWTLTLAPTDPSVTITTGSGGYPSDTTLDLAESLKLPPGHWWLVFYPTMGLGCCGQFGRQPADTLNGHVGQFVNPGGGFGYGTVWQDWTVIGPTQHDIAFRLHGWWVADVPWLMEDPVAGAVPPGQCQDVTVTFLSAFAGPGDYDALLFVLSNDPDEPTLTVPVQMTVLDCAATELHLNRTRIFQRSGPPWQVRVTAQLQVYDLHNAAVPGAAVAGLWTPPTMWPVWGVPFFGATDYLGREKFQYQQAMEPGPYQFCVTGITLPGYWWSPADPLACMSLYVP